MNKRLFKISIATTATVAVLIGLGTAVIKYNDWSTKNRIVVTPPVVVTFNKPFRVEEIKPEVIVEKFTLDYPDEINTPIEKYICQKFGPWDCKTALAVFSAESGLREDAININSNNTIDYGIAQINTVHFKKPGCSMKELVIAEKNVDCAYRIWDESDPEHKLGDGKGSFTPWVGFWNNNYKAHL